MANRRKMHSLWLDLITYSFILFLHLDLPVVCGDNRRDRYSDYHHTESKEPYVTLCITQEQFEGECRSLSECWTTENGNYQLQRCNWNGYRATFCCPDLTEETAEFVTSYGRNPARYPETPGQKAVTKSTNAPVRSLFDVVGPFLSTLFNPRPAENEKLSMHANPPPFVTEAPIRLPDSSYTSKPIRNPTLTVAQAPIRLPDSRYTSKLIRNPTLTVTQAPIRLPDPIVTSKPIRYPAATPPKVLLTTKRPYIIPARQSVTSSPWMDLSTRRSNTAPAKPSVASTRKSVVMPSDSPVQLGCGQRFPKHGQLIDARSIQTYVIGGHDAEEHSWPWMVSIYYSRNGTPYRFTCGGSLITNRHVLTAAHCFDTMKEGNVRFSIKVGSNHITSNASGPSSFKEEFINVLSVRIHEHYSPRIYYHDIALLTLVKTVTFNERTLPICFPSSEDLKAVTTQANVTLTGWGHTSYGGTKSNVLQEAALQIMPLSRCQLAYSSFQQTESLSQGVTTNMLCAGVAQGGSDACQGDSGGPLMMKNGGRWIQVGIVSFGYRCGSESYPGVYTRVSTYMRWINRVLSEYFISI